MSYDNTNTGAIFKNDKKTEKQPDYRGTINVEGKDYEIALWIKTSQKGTQFLSAAIQEPREAQPEVKSDLPF